MIFTKSWLVLAICLFTWLEVARLDNFLNKLYLAERKLSVKPYNAPVSLRQLHEAHISKRLFRKSGRRGTAKWVGTARNVLAKVGGSIKKAAVKAKDFIKKHLGKVKEAFKKIQAKVSKAVARAKEVLAKYKAVKYVLFLKDCSTAIWKAMPEGVKDMLFDKIVDASIGDLDNLEELTDDEFNPDELEDDDDLARELGADYDDLAKELGLDYDDELEDDIEELAPADKKLIKKGPKAKELDNLEIARHIRSDKCCCISVDGKETGAETVADEDLGDAEVDDSDSQLVDIDLSDFDEASLEGDDYDDLLSFDDIEIEKRGIPVRKRATCSCGSTSIARREYVRGIQIRKQKDKNSLPALTSTLPGHLITKFLELAKIKTEKPICQDKKSDDCMDLGDVRFGALSALLATKVLCPSCDLVVTSVQENLSNPFMKSWMFYIKGTDELSVFLTEALKTYDGQTDLFDGNNNRWSIVEGKENSFFWKFKTHL